MSDKIYVPGDPSPDAHPLDVYTVEMHEANIGLLANYVSVLGIDDPEGVMTPWMITDKGVARVQGVGEDYTTKVVETRPQGYHGLAAHDVKHVIKVGQEGLVSRAHTKNYLPIHQHLGILLMNQPISAGMMLGYPTLDYNPLGVSETLKAHLHNPEEQVAADPASLSRLLARNAWMIRNWIGVRV